MGFPLLYQDSLKSWYQYIVQSLEVAINLKIREDGEGDKFLSFRLRAEWITNKFLDLLNEGDRMYPLMVIWSKINDNHLVRGHPA